MKIHDENTLLDHEFCVETAHVFIETIKNILFLSEIEREKSFCYHSDDELEILYQYIEPIDKYIRTVIATTKDRTLIIEYAKISFGNPYIWKNVPPFEVLNELFIAPYLLEINLSDGELQVLVDEISEFVELVFDGNDELVDQTIDYLGELLHIEIDKC